MEQDARAVADHSEVPVPDGVVGAAGGGLAREAAPSEAGNAGGRGAAGPESDEESDIEEAQTEESERVVAPVGNAGQADAPGSAQPQNEDHEVPENPATIHFELRGFRPARRAIAHAMPPSTYRRLPLRGRKRHDPTRLPVVGDAASGVFFSNAYDAGTSEAASGPPPPSASLGSPSVTSRSAGVSAMVNDGNGDSKEALGSTAIRFELHAAVGQSSPGGLRNGADAAAAEASSSRRLPSRGRKQRRPDHFISDSEEAASANRAKARRSNAALDRFLTSSFHAAPAEQVPEWVRKNITEGSARDQGQSGNDALRARAPSGGVTEEPDGSARILAVAAILGAALALSAVSCALFYIVGQQTSSGPCDSHKKK